MSAFFNFLFFLVGIIAGILLVIVVAAAVSAGQRDNQDFTEQIRDRTLNHSEEDDGK